MCKARHITKKKLLEKQMKTSTLMPAAAANHTTGSDFRRHAHLVPNRTAFARSNQPVIVHNPTFEKKRTAGDQQEVSMQKCATAPRCENEFKQSTESHCADQQQQQQKKKTKSNEKKRVSFLPTAYVVLIPTTAEYHNAGLAPDLWWGENDYRTFKTGAIQEIQEYLNKNPHLEVKKAVKKFYQELSSEDVAENVGANTSRNCNLSAPQSTSSNESESKQDQNRDSSMMASDEQKQHLHPPPLSLIPPRKQLSSHTHPKSIPRPPSVDSMPSYHHHQSASAAAASMQLMAAATKAMPPLDYNSPQPVDRHSPFEMMNLISKVAAMVLGSMVPNEN